jgi:hypothetical protein
LRFAVANPKPCPILPVSQPGDTRFPTLGANLDISGIPLVNSRTLFLTQFAAFSLEAKASSALSNMPIAIKTLIHPLVPSPIEICQTADS